ncbi:uncharacterized protein LOC130137113 [Syzygium oleosum]|uniref:uncharacterized protein LOC130137113 n=1 Tax=Syzygium oleosum TaxID=219896 RepID=UPI0024B9B499|nr:uncharacterized protein LOC130137113 [Syzygium oleosum]
MGKREKKQRHQRHPRREASHYLEGGEDSFSYENLPSASKPPLSDEEDEEEEVEEEEQEQEHDSQSPSLDIPSKFLLYQQSVQSPKGDISYLQKFFLMYVGGRQALHLQEDFCGTALLCIEWLRNDPRHKCDLWHLCPTTNRYCLTPMTPQTQPHQSVSHYLPALSDSVVWLYHRLCLSLGASCNP